MTKKITLNKLTEEIILESSETKWDFSLPNTESSILVSSEIISGLAFKLWGAIGVMIKFFEFGEITGPLQLSEYPVEPVGVAIIRPSDQ